MQLDINTPKGQLTLIQEQYVIEKIKEIFKVDIVITDKKREAAFDGMITKNGELKAFFEVKCRNMTEEQMRKMPVNPGCWLITHQKLIDGSLISKLSTCPYLGFLYLVPDNKILWWKITNDKGEFEFEYKIEKTKTQYCVNGGTALRENAYLHMNHSKELK